MYEIANIIFLTCSIFHDSHKRSTRFSQHPHEQCAIRSAILSIDLLNPYHWQLRLCQQISPTTIQNPGPLLLWYAKSDHGFLYIKNAWSSRHVHCSSAYTILSSNFDFLDLFQATSVTSWPIFYVESSHGIKHFEIIMFFIFVGCRNFVLSFWWASTNGTGPREQNELKGIGMNWMHACMHACILFFNHTYMHYINIYIYITNLN